jgi:hypothetical protein
MIHPARLAAALIASAFAAAAILLLSGCETLRLGIATDYGTFSYEMPKPTSSK